MELIILPEYTGKDNYLEVTDSPIAQAIKALGFTDVIVGPYDWEATSPTFGGKVYGVISEEVDTLEYAWATQPLTEPLKITLKDPTEKKKEEEE